MDMKNTIKEVLNKIIVSLIILFMVMQYMIVPTYAILSEGKLIGFPLDMNEIIFQKVASGGSGGVSFLGIDTNGNLWAKGVDSTGCLGIGAYTNSWDYTIKQVKSGTKFLDIVMGYEQSFAIDSQNNLWSTGKNTYGKLGDGTTTDKEEFVQIMKGKKFKKVSTSGNSATAIDLDGNLYFWGLEEATADENTPQSTWTYYSIPIQIMNGVKFKDITSASHVQVALTSDGKIYVWGQGDYVGGGILNDGEKINSSSPKQIAIGYTFDDIESGYYHILALDSLGKLYVLGNNSYGQLGNDSTTSSTLPINIKSNSIFTKISASKYTSYAIDSEGTLWGWGYNADYELADGTTTNSRVPKKMMEDKEITYIEKGIQSYYAIDSNGILWGWSNRCSWPTGSGWTHAYQPIQITAFYYNVKFYDENGTTLLDTQKVLSESEGTTNITPTKKSTQQYNYTFEKWVAMDGSDIDLSSITEDTNVKAKYKENLRGYKVTFKNHDGTILQEKDVNYGEKATYTGSIPTKNIDGYNITLNGWTPNLDTTTITKDTVFTATYTQTPINYNITYEGIEDAEFTTTNPTTYTIETESFTLTNPTKQGYTFNGWEGTGITSESKNVTITKGSIGDRQYTALWTTNNNTKYKIEHYKQLQDGTYSDTPDETENKEGTTGQIATAETKSYVGYIYDIGKSTPTGTIKADGSLILKMYYKANENTAYKVEHYLQNVLLHNGGGSNYTIDESATENKVGITGAQTEAKAKDYVGFTVQSFEQKEILGDGSTVVRIYYNRNTNTAYKVEHYLQNVGDDQYTIDSTATENKVGTTGAQTEAKAKDYVGFTVQSFEQKEILGDGSTVVKIYYNRNKDTQDDGNHIKVTPIEEEGKKKIEISSDSSKEIVKVTVNGEEVEKNEEGKYIFTPTKNGIYEIEVTYSDGSIEKYTYKETRFKEEGNIKQEEDNNNKKEEEKNKKSGITTDTTIAKKILSKTGIGYTGAIAVVISSIISICIIIKKRKQK